MFSAREQLSDGLAVDPLCLASLGEMVGVG